MAAAEPRWEDPFTDFDFGECVFACGCPCVQVARNMESGAAMFWPKVLMPIGFATITWRILMPILTITGILQSKLLPAFGVGIDPPRTGFYAPYLFGSFVFTVLLQKFRRRLAKERGIHHNPPCPTIFYQCCCLHFIPIMQETRAARQMTAPFSKADNGGPVALVGTPVGVVPGTGLTHELRLPVDARGTDEAGKAAGQPKTAWGPT